MGLNKTNQTTEIWNISQWIKYFNSFIYKKKRQIYLVFVIERSNQKLRKIELLKVAK